MRLGFSPGAWRDWKGLPASVQTRLKEKLLRYAQDPLRYAVKLSDGRIGGYRFRIGDYRVIFEIEHGTLIVLAVGHRKEIYRSTAALRVVRRSGGEFPPLTDRGSFAQFIGGAADHHIARVQTADHFDQVAFGCSLFHVYPLGAAV